MWHVASDLIDKHLLSIRSSILQWLNKSRHKHNICTKPLNPVLVVEIVGIFSVINVGNILTQEN
uniref:Uncharacterized protein n=1 Tax=Solanum tuberosum TaxID=4113 RepID=M0ZGK1_SOLTU